MQKWEYCTVGPIKSGGDFHGFYPQVIYLTQNGRKVTPIKGTKSLSEAEVLAQMIAQLGEDGWELVGTGDVSVRDGYEGKHTLYFKRPKE